MPREFWLLGAIVLVGLSVHAVETGGRLHEQSHFLGVDNLSRLAKEAAMLGIFSLGAGVVIIAGGIDLSAGSVVCFAAVICAMTPEWLGRGHDETLSIGLVAAMMSLALGAGAVVGVLHGAFVTSLGLPPFVATLGTMAGLRSLASVVTTGSIAVDDPTFRMIGKAWYVPVLIFAVEFALIAALMRSTWIGRHLYAMGGNEEAARLSGLRVSSLKFLAYAIGAVTAALAGLVYLANVGAASPKLGLGYELSGIAAAVVGGCSLRGGSGSIGGIALGAFLLKLVVNGAYYVIPKGSTEWEGMIVGVVVILAVLLGKLGGK
jgi:ribose/xylose/arabinose/galactoside ABC-type transport system permease subunit